MTWKDLDETLAKLNFTVGQRFATLADLPKDLQASVIGAGDARADHWRRSGKVSDETRLHETLQAVKNGLKKIPQGAAVELALHFAELSPAVTVYRREKNTGNQNAAKENPKEAFIGVSVSKELKAAVLDKCKRSGVKLSAWVIDALEQKLNSNYTAQ